MLLLCPIHFGPLNLQLMLFAQSDTRILDTRDEYLREVENNVLNLVTHIYTHIPKYVGMFRSFPSLRSQRESLFYVLCHVCLLYIHGLRRSRLRRPRPLLLRVPPDASPARATNCRELRRRNSYPAAGLQECWNDKTARRSRVPV